MEQETDKILIRKFITGNCTSQEQEYIKRLMLQTGGQELFEQVMDEDWQEFKNETPATDQYIQNFQHRLNSRLDDVKPDLVIKRNHFYKYVAIWTVLILGIAAYGALQLNSTQTAASIAMLSSHNPNGQRSKITLSDGSVVTLGAGSHLTYPEHFSNNTREISLEGEAFFEITKNPEKPFIIHTGAVQTKVLGTSFKVDAFKGEEVQVAVATGIVRVDRKAENTGKLESIAVLLPGDAVNWNPATGTTIKRKQAIEELTGWQKGKLSFTGMPLKNVVNVLERWYNVTIEIRNKEAGEYKMNIILDGTQPLKQLMEVIKVTTKTHYKMNGKTITIW
ncbi:fec operon regulator FecR [compost metagenome]